jgi:release factor glutamine methyltransferase
MDVCVTAIADRLRAAGCVFAEDEAALLMAAAGSPGELSAMVARRAGGIPLEQIVGWTQFAGLRIAVDPGVFVPRQRSELLVRAVTAVAAGKVAPVIVDLCCGAGALGAAVAAAFPGAELHAADLDPAAVACARRNVAPAGGVVHAGDLFAPLPRALRGRVAILVCNAPYVPSGDIQFMPREARDHEARMALDGGDDGLAVLRRVAEQAPGWLAPGGVVGVETSERQAPAMLEIMDRAGLSGQLHNDPETAATAVTGTAPATGR